MKLIGKGDFTRAYLQTNGKVFLKSVCPVKECMAHGWFPNSRLFPKIKQVNCDEHCTMEYEMEYYPKVKSLKQNLDPKEYQMYKDLRALSIGYTNNPHNFYHLWYEQFETLKNKRLREAMIDALDGCSNFGSTVCFEISPRNVATKNGKLILLDCFFIHGTKSMNHKLYHQLDKVSA